MFDYGDKVEIRGIASENQNLVYLWLLGSDTTQAVVTCETPGVNVPFAVPLASLVAA